MPGDIEDLDKIPRIASDAVDYYNTLISRSPELKSKTRILLRDGECNYIASSQMNDVRELGEYVVVRSSTRMDIPGYTLHSMILYESGHYVAIVYEDGWVLCNDERLYQIERPPDNPYLLIYRIVQ